MLSENENWQRLKSWMVWASRYHQAALLLTGAVLPVLECVFVNLLTGAETGKAWPFGVALTGLGVAHAVLLGLILLWGKGAEIVCAANAVEAEQKLAAVQLAAQRREEAFRQEIDRRAECQRMIRSAIEDVNLQACQINPTAPNAFCNGFGPVIQRLVGNIRTTLGVTSNQFTIELYCDAGVISQGNPCGSPDGVIQELFYSPHGLDPCTPVMQLGARAPHRWARSRGLPGYCRIEDDKNLFYEGDKPAPGIYFRIFATVPVAQVCSPLQVGLLILTSMQTEPFSEDVLDTLQFLASLVSQYIAAHNRCVSEWRDNQMRLIERQATAPPGQSAAPKMNTGPHSPRPTSGSGNPMAN